ncbi:uncharacterized protein PV09_06173 [Verruconis gallopava]|uniref:GH16 domain-containing protein n=1 Tax=Verruconis gallopava TaxID=253628 RepID=A0A0D1XJ79_9PEZI|nr:uncharacterized protein PV09_06173 [Verruconis gallopava]KIW02351.1 hypothetical protein PV09_06173 [Verruconis gallopava]
MASTLPDCDCGFVDAKDPTKSTFSNFLAINFTSITNQTFEDLFIPASYTLNLRGGPYNRAFSPEQVHLSQDGLALTVSPLNAGNVPCAQVTTKNESFFYGAYHVQTRVGNVPGAVSAFFTYKNDTSEVDIEYLSAWTDPTLLYTVKPQLYSASGNPLSGTYQKEQWNGTGAFSKNFHTWSFVWLPGIVHYGLDGEYSRVITTNVPQDPGSVSISHWSDGNPNYSMGPPTSDSTDVISLFWAVYNDTSSAAPACKATKTSCTISDGVLQSATSSSGGSTNSPTPTPTIKALSTSSAQMVSPMNSSWIFVLILFCWFGQFRLKWL